MMREINSQFLIVHTTQDEGSDCRISSDYMGNLSDFVGSDRNASEIVGILVTGFLSEVVGVGKRRNVVVPIGTRLIRHFPTSDNFRSESDTKDFNKNHHVPIGSYKIR